MADSAKSATTIDTSKPDEDTKWPTGIKVIQMIPSQERRSLREHLNFYVYRMTWL